VGLFNNLIIVSMKTTTDILLIELSVSGEKGLGSINSLPNFLSCIVY
jgi:hypothetical protein